MLQICIPVNSGAFGTVSSSLCCDADKKVQWKNVHSVMVLNCVGWFTTYNMFPNVEVEVGRGGSSSFIFDDMKAGNRNDITIYE